MAASRAPAWTPPTLAPLATVEVAGRRLHHVELGRGEPVVLIHGLGGSWRWWSRNIEPLAEHFRVFALDLSRREHWLRGQGRVRPREADDVLAAWLDRVDLGPVHLVGHSLGGHMAIRLSARHPERVRRLVLIASVGLPFGAGLLRLTARALGPVPERTLAFRRLVLADSLRTNPLVVLQTAREMLRDDLTGLLERIAAPTQIIWGERDPMVPVANAHRLHAAIAGSRLLIIPRAGHNPMYYHPAVCNRTMIDFLGGAAAA
jgi:pimeloyl-ACP methyl ester carboxylesterase